MSLRDMVFSILVALQLTDCGNPLDLKDDEFIDAVNSLIELREKQYIIDVLDVGAGQKGDFEQLQIESSLEAVVKSLREGSPCIAQGQRYNSRDAMADENTWIVGYDQDILICMNSNREYFELDNSELEQLEDFRVIRKYGEEGLGGLGESVRKLVERRPYLDRSSYEKGIRMPTTERPHYRYLMRRLTSKCVTRQPPILLPSIIIALPTKSNLFKYIFHLCPFSYTPHHKHVAEHAGCDRFSNPRILACFG